MTKKQFIELADMVRRMEKDYKDRDGDAAMVLMAYRERLARFCFEQNTRFDQVRWHDYIDGKCGPSGGEIKKKK